MLLVASETGHVYTFATEKLQPMITSEEGKNLIQSCLSYGVGSGGGGGSETGAAQSMSDDPSGSLEHGGNRADPSHSAAAMTSSDAVAASSSRISIDNFKPSDYYDDEEDDDEDDEDDDEDDEDDECVQNDSSDFIEPNHSNNVRSRLF